MKKLVCFYVAIIFMFSMIGCAKEEAPDESIKDAPEFIADLFNGMNDLAKEHDFKFKAYDYSASIIDLSFLFQYTVKVPSEERHPILSFSFDDENPSAGLSVIGIWQDHEEDRPEYLNDIITALIMTIEPSLSLQDARDETQKLMDSRPTKDSETRYGDTVEVGDYTLWFMTYSDTKLQDSCQLCFEMKKSAELLGGVPENKDEYTVLTKEYISEALSSGNKVQVTGTVTDCYIPEWDQYSGCKVQSNDGQMFLFAYDYGYEPIEFKVGDTFTFFGETVNDSFLNADESAPLILLESFYSE